MASLHATELRGDLVESFDSAEEVELAVFDALPPDARSTVSVGEWSPKDVLAHLTAWRDRQVLRMEREARGEPPDASAARETDEINAEIHEERAGWDWQTAVSEAAASWDRLRMAVRDADAERLSDVGGMIAGLMGNGPSHDLQHLPAIARISGTEQRVGELNGRLGAIAERGAFPERDAGTLIYNLACWASLDGNLDSARRLLTRAFRLRPDLIEYAPTDSDLAALHGELEQLAPG